MSQKSFWLIFSILVLFALGLLMVFNATSAEVLDRGLAKSTHHALIRQILYAFLGGLLAVGVWFLGYQEILRLSGYFLCLATLLLAVVFIPGIGKCINGANRWIWIGSYSFQPSEFVKFLIPLHFIFAITTYDKPILLKDFLKILARFVIPIGLILIEPDNGTVAIILATLFVLFLLTKIRWVYWGLPLLVLCVVGMGVAYQMPHVHHRISIYLHPELDLQGKGHQPHQAKIAVGSGGMWGQGLGESLQKLDYLPEARCDYISAIFAEEFGFAGILVLLLLYMFIGYLGFSMAVKIPDLAAFYTVTIVTFLICFQAFLNLGVVSGLLPSKGINLPFFSQGGTSLLANFMAICIILNIANRKTIPYEKTS